MSMSMGSISSVSALQPTRVERRPPPAADASPVAAPAPPRPAQPGAARGTLENPAVQRPAGSADGPPDHRVPVASGAAVGAPTDTAAVAQQAQAVYLSNLQAQAGHGDPQAQRAVSFLM